MLDSGYYGVYRFIWVYQPRVVLDKLGRLMSMPKPVNYSLRNKFLMKLRSAAMLWLNVPHIQQTNDGWCLPACVAMVSAYLEQPLLQEDVARWLNTIGRQFNVGLDTF
ncbi:MAG: hypothetical protein DYG89_40570 [Caldilinea sp. CFX5]|nr:hypothetical protein [Caldilinea sp. CFX5]